MGLSGRQSYHVKTLPCAYRLQAIAAPLVSNMEKVQIIPPPKEVDRRVLVWKGAAVLGKMDGVSELWVTQSDWVSSVFHVIWQTIKGCLYRIFSVCEGSKNGVSTCNLFRIW